MQIGGRRENVVKDDSIGNIKCMIQSVNRNCLGSRLWSKKSAETSANLSVEILIPKSI